MSSNNERGYTDHGHAVYGVAQIEPPPESRARCGGPGLCTPCSTQAATLQAQVGYQSPGKHKADPPTTPPGVATTLPGVEAPAGPLDVEPLRVGTVVHDRGGYEWIRVYRPGGPAAWLRTDWRDPRERWSVWSALQHPVWLHSEPRSVA